MGEARVAVVTGGASGIGEAIGRRLHADGFRLLLVDVDGRALERGASSFGAGPDVVAHRADVRNVGDCQAAIQQANERFGRLDVLVNSAGVSTDGPADAVTEDDWDRVVGVNLKGTFFMCRYAIPELEKTGGCVVNIASDLGLQGGSEASVYCASKGGVVNLTRALAIELAGRGIRVNAICPADVDTPMSRNAVARKGGADPDAFRRALLARYPQRPPRLIQADEVADLTAFLVSTNAAPITGVAMPIDFGISAGVIRPASG